MKKYLKIVLFYLVGLIIIIQILTVALKDTWFCAVEGYVSYFILFAMLYHIGLVMQDRLIRKKYLVYISIIASEVVINLLLMTMLNVSSEGIWIGLIALNVIFATVFIMLLDI